MQLFTYMWILKSERNPSVPKSVIITKSKTPPRFKIPKPWYFANPKPQPNLSYLL